MGEEGKQGSLEPMSSGYPAGTEPSAWEVQDKANNPEESVSHPKKQHTGLERT